MKIAGPITRRKDRGIMLLETLFYMSILVIVLGCGTALLYQSWGNNITLRRTTDDIISTLNAGELWRADIRSATGQIQTTPEAVQIPTANGIITYSFATNLVRRESPNQPARTLANVKASRMFADSRGQVPAWRWEVELNSNRKKIQLRPLFTFEAVASHGASK
jgi:hypothetical protein